MPQREQDPWVPVQVRSAGMTMSVLWPAELPAPTPAEVEWLGRRVDGMLSDYFRAEAMRVADELLRGR